MDQSLDDYITTKKGRNFGARGRGRGGGGGVSSRLGGTGPRRLSSSPTKVSDRLGTKDNRPEHKGSAMSRLGNAGAVTKRTAHQRPKFSPKGLAMDAEAAPTSKAGNLKVVVTDARQRLSMNSGGGRQDARMKLSRKTEVVDARSKIKSRSSEKTVSVGRPKTVTIGRPSLDLDMDDDEEEDQDITWMKTIKNPTLTRPRSQGQGMGIQRIINNQAAPQIVRHDETDLTIVRNFRPSLATFSVDDGGSHDGSEQEDKYGIRITRKVPQAEPVYSLPDYSDLLRDTQRKLDAGHGDVYYGKMQADQESTGTYIRVHKVTEQRTNAVEAPIITFKNDKIGQGRPPRKTDPRGIIALPPRRKPQAPTPQQEEAMEVDATPMELVSPLQGFRITVTNLHPAVTQEDIIELFACIGPLKKARLVKKGSAEVVFVRKDDALAAVKRYHNRLLDNMPMVVKCVASAAQLKAASASTSLTSKSKEQQPPIDLDLDVVHRALFRNNSKDQGSAQPVQFLVKI